MDTDATVILQKSLEDIVVESSCGWPVHFKLNQETFPDSLKRVLATKVALNNTMERILVQCIYEQILKYSM